MPRFAHALLAVAVAASVAGCSLLEDDPPARADTVAGDETPAADAGSGDTLTAEQAKAALLTIEDLPTGWSADESADEDEPEPTTKPARCAAVFAGLDEQEPKAEAKAAFTSGGSIIEHTVRSWDGDAADLVKQTTAAFSKCKKFTSIDADGSEATFRMSKLSFPNVGDRTLAMRANSSLDGVDVVLDLIFVGEGKTTFLLTAGGLAPLPGDDLEAIATKAVEKLR